MSEATTWPSSLIEELQTGNVIPFIGAGFSAPSGLPTWHDLLTALMNEVADLGLSELRSQFDRGTITSLDAPELHQTLFGTRFPLLDYVVSRFSQPALPNNYHSLLGQFRVDTIITTNYDKLIERHFESRGDAVHPIWRDYHVSQYNERDALQVIKLHGHVDDPESIVLSRQDYERYLETHQLLYALVSVLFATRTILFLGCSLSDPNISGLLRELRRRTGAFTRSHYVLLYSPTTADVSAVRSLGLQVIECVGSNRELALESWLDGLVRRSQVVARDNAGKSRMINKAIRYELPLCLPGAVIRMRAAMGIISHPRAIPTGTVVYGDSLQDSLETEMGELAREFLRKHPKNRIRTIVHINPEIQLRKGFSRPALRLRLEAMLDFLKEFPGQIELAQSELPISGNHVIIGDKISFLAFKNTGGDMGYQTMRGTRNRWTIRSEIDAFDSDFTAVVSSNRTRAAEIGIDTAQPGWHSIFSETIIAMALETLETKDVVLECDDHGTILSTVDRTHAHATGVRHCSVHLCLFAMRAGRRHALLQRRASHHSLYPGMVSVAVTGHPELPDLRREMLRECSEELGLWLDPDELTLCGTFHRRTGTDVEVVTLFAADVTEHSVAVARRVSEDVDCLYWISADGPASNTPIPAIGIYRIGSQWRDHQCVLLPGDVISGTFEEIALAADSLLRHE